MPSIHSSRRPNPPLSATICGTLYVMNVTKKLKIWTELQLILAYKDRSICGKERLNTYQIWWRMCEPFSNGFQPSKTFRNRRVPVEISNAVYRLTVLYQKCTSFLTLKYFILSRHIYLPFTRSFYLKCYIEAKDKKYFGALSFLSCALLILESLGPGVEQSRNILRSCEINRWHNKTVVIVRHSSLTPLTVMLTLVWGIDKKLCITPPTTKDT